MYEKHPEAETMFAALDRDGGGSLDRKELAVGLFSLGIWLHPSELAVLLEALDEDGGGNIDLEEFQSFWSKYSFE
jgi:Ca2+-binding EF-hand superfamily protein